MRGNRRFAFRLCKVLGYAHPDELLGELTASQFEEWKAYNAIEPISDSYRLEYSIAMLSSLVMNLAQAVHSKSPKEYSVDDFLIKWDSLFTEKPVVKQSPEDMINLLLKFGARRTKKGDTKNDTGNRESRDITKSGN